MKTNNLTRININIPTKLAQRIKKYSNDLGIPFTQGYILLLTKALDSEDLIQDLPKLVETLINMKENSSDTNI